MGSRIELFVFFIFIQIHFMGLIFIPDVLIKLLVVLSFFTTGLTYKPQLFKEFRLPILLLFIACAINMVSSYYLRGQSIYQYLVGLDFLNIVGILSFFAIPFFGITAQRLEKTLIMLSVFFVFCYLLQYVIYPTPLFVNFKDNGLALSVRPRMPGQSLLFLCYFYFLNRLMLGFSWQFLFYFAISILAILILGFRSQILVLVMLTFLMIVISTKISFKKKTITIVAGLVFISILYNMPIVQYKVQQMAERQQRGDVLSDDDYIRNRTFYYYTQEFPINNYEKYMGTGLPSLSSKYGKSVQDIKQSGIVWADWGLIGLSWMLGIPGVICILWYSLKAALLNIDKRHYYLKFWFLFMVLGSIFTREIFRDGNFAIQGVVLYLISYFHLRYMRINRYKMKYGF